MGKSDFSRRATLSGVVVLDVARTAWRSGYGVCVLALLVVMFVSGNAALAEPRGAVCRVSNRLATSSSMGSGTLVDKTDDGREGLVLTCAHLFSEGVGTIVVEFPDGKSHGAKLVAVDRAADLAALAISNPSAESVAVRFDWPHSQRLQACGFGPHGEYRCAQGAVVGEANNAGQTSVLIGDAVRSGDSGGGVFDNEGNLVAVVWGESGGVTYASTGAPLRRFLDRVLGKRTAVVYRCPNGVCPRVPQGGGASQPLVPITPPLTSPPTEVGSPILIEIERRIAALEVGKQDRGDYVTRGESVGWDAKPRAAEGLGDLIGIGGATGWGVVAATTVGGWLVGWLWRRVGGRRGSGFPHGHA